ncbi:MAG: glycoside hydrolase family 31 protein [Lachnospiraceae bacterium]|nr:glycoside hydrolase family 31 protein [Lachnospiraceae bacterium]
MIRKYTYGSPFQTDAVVQQKKTEHDTLPYFEEIKEDGQLTLKYQLDQEDAVYGLGENVRGINKRGWIYESRCMDDPVHVETSHSLYASHNFFVVSGRQSFGVFVDYAGIISFDMGYTHLDELVMKPQEADLDIYIIEGDSILDIVRQFRQLVGQSYIPPKWAFGYQQCRWSYMDEDEIRAVVKNHRENQIPLDSVYLDIDYMERYKDFSINEETFPDFEGFVQEMKEQHVRLVPIIDAGVKIEEGYETYEEGVKNHYFCKNADGTDFVAGVWPGRVHFPDVLNPKARDWFGKSYKFLLDKGIEGFWNDMNEPALFYSEEHLQQVFEKLGEFQGRNLDLDTYNQFLGMIHGLPNNREDYKLFFHNINGKMVRHDKVHNLFGYNMTRAAGEAFEELEPDKRILMFSRSSYVGMHRYGGIWMGDNKAWWGHLLMSIKMQPSLNMMGILYTGADIGGFGDDTTEDLMMRWLQFAVFNPLMRNHAAMGTRDQEVYRFDHTEDFRKIIQMRYALVPYIYSEYMKAVLKSDMYFKPLSFVYPEDSHASQVEDQLMVGESLMCAPIYTQNATGRYVYLPEEMLMLRVRGPEDYTCERMCSGHHYVDAKLSEMLLFLRPGHLLVLVQPADSVEQLDTTKVKVIGFKGQRASYELYDDDGFSRNYDLDQNVTKITVEEDGSVTVAGAAKLCVETELAE